MGNVSDMMNFELFAPVAPSAFDSADDPFWLETPGVQLSWLFSREKYTNCTG